MHNEVIDQIQKSLESFHDNLGAEAVQSLPQSTAQVEQTQAVIEQLHSDVVDANEMLGNDSSAEAQDQIKKIKDNLRYLEDNLINQAAEQAAKQETNGTRLDIN